MAPPPTSQRSTSDLISAVSAAGVDDSIQASFSDALEALENYSLEDVGVDASEKASAAADFRSEHPREPTPNTRVLGGSKEDLQRRIVQSARILRKLCSQKSCLESRVQQLEAEAAAFQTSQSTFEDITPSCAQSSCAPASLDGSKPSCTHDLLHRKDAVIDQLQAALQSSQRQVALLRGALRAKGKPNSGHQTTTAGKNDIVYAGKLAPRDSSDSRRLKQLQHDYRLLLDSKISKLENRAEADAMRLLKTMRQRLAASAEEGEAQARLLSGRLADLERAQMDWYVEKRLMQEQHASLQQECERLQAELRQQETRSAAAGLQPRPAPGRL